MLQVLCPPGKWSKATGLAQVCTQPCAPGYACSAGSTAPDLRPCGAPELYCPEGSGQPLVSGPGRFTSGGSANGTTRTDVSDCPATGVYCPGSGAAMPCAPGFFGNASRLATSSCSGPCAPGYFCVAGSSSPTTQPCGSISVYATITVLHDESWPFVGCKS